MSPLMATNEPFSFKEFSKRKWGKPLSLWCPKCRTFTTHERTPIGDYRCVACHTVRIFKARGKG
jgi:hypothetical protein